MSRVMFDPEVFIEEIRKRPALWDPKAGLHGKRDGKNSDWDAVGNVMFPKWNAMKGIEKQLRVKQMASKWKNIKDKYRRSIKDNLTGMELGKPKKTYVYHNQLLFLNQGKDPIPDSVFDGMEELVNDSDTQFVRETEVLPPPAKKTRKKKDPKKQRPEDSNKSVPSKASVFEYNTNIREDRMFFLSLAPMVYGMREDIKIQTKIEIMQIIQRNKQGTSQFQPTTSENFSNNFIEVSNIVKFEREDNEEKPHSSSDDSDSSEL